MRALLLVIVAGCWWHEAPPPATVSSEPPPAEAPLRRYREPAGPDCSSLATVVQNVLSGSSMAAQLPPIIDAVTASCTEDDWSAELIACFAAVSDEHQLQTCVRTMSTEQRDKLGNRVMTAMQGTIAPPPPPPAPTP